MKALILFACTIAIASAGWIPFIGGHQEEHHPIIHDGVPLDTPEVQHARAEHFAAVAEAKAHAGPEIHHEEHYDHHEHIEIPSHDEHHEDHGYGYSIQHVTAHHGHAHDDHQEHTSVVHHPHTVPHYTHPAYETSHQEPIVDHDGTPLDTPEVEKAKALHFAEVHKALARLHEHGGHAHSLHRRDLADFALHVEDDHSHGYELHQNHAPVYGHHESHDHHEIPQIGHDGKPLDTAEVEHAKALHFHAHQEALARVAHAKQHEQPEYQHHEQPEYQQHYHY